MEEKQPTLQSPQEQKPEESLQNKIIIPVVIIILLLVAGAFFYQYWWLPKGEISEEEKIEEAILPEELPKITEKEITNWQTLSEFGFSLRIPPDYAQKVFRKSETGLIADYRNNDEERILITYQIMGEEATDLAKDIYRNFIQRAGNLRGKTVKEITEIMEEDLLLQLILTSYFSETSEFISAQEIKKENCLIFALTFKTDEKKREKSLDIISSYDPDFMWGIIFFYNEESETEILKIIQTIKYKSS